MNDLIDRKAAIDAFEGIELAIEGRQNAETVKMYIGRVIDRIKALPTAEPQTEINMAYMRGKIDGINYCTERLCKMRMEVDNEQT